jgi:uncharacterized protein YbaP (TraB family)
MMKVYFLINKMISNIRGTSSIFDPLGIETVENILKSERKAELENHLAKLRRRIKLYHQKPQTLIKSVLKFCKTKEHNVVRDDAKLMKYSLKSTAIQGI